MDFTKLNIEFANMQNIIVKYNNIQSEIKNKIKNDYKEISKYESKLKNTKNNIEKESYKLIIISIKNETTFLEGLVEEEKKDEKSV